MVYDFGPRLAALRKARGWTQKYVANRIDMSSSVIGAYESDAVIPSLDAAAALASTFGVSLDYLVDGDKSRCLSAKDLTDDQVQLVTDLVHELSVPTGHSPLMSEEQSALLRRIIAEFTK